MTVFWEMVAGKTAYPDIDCSGHVLVHVVQQQQPIAELSDS